jgi:UbiD family decarboxylase
MVPANAEVVLECELMATEGWVHDEAPFGEFTGMYGGGLKHNVRAVVKAITHRKSGIFHGAEQHRLREDSQARRRRRQAGAVRNARVVKDGDPESRLCF